MTVKFCDKVKLACAIKTSLDWTKANCNNAYYVPIKTELVEQILSFLDQKEN